MYINQTPRLEPSKAVLIYGFLQCRLPKINSKSFHLAAINDGFDKPCPGALKITTDNVTEVRNLILADRDFS